MTTKSGSIRKFEVIGYIADIEVIAAGPGIRVLSYLLQGGGHIDISA